MTTPHIAWAFKQGVERKLPPSERLVLIALAEKANGSRLCWPSLPHIADLTGLSPRTCHTAVHRLERAGLVRLELRGRSMHYHILRPADPMPNGFDGGDQGKYAAHGPPPQPEPLQPLQGSEPEPLQPLQDSAPDLPPSETTTLATIARPPLQPLQDTPPTTLAMVASYPLKEERTPKNPPNKGAQARAGEREAAFKIFYENYPKKRAPDAARKALFARLDAGVPLEDILEGLSRHVFATQEKFIPYPERWLNAGQWRDETYDRNAATLRAAGIGPDGRSTPRLTGFEGMIGWQGGRQ